jgi:hypothetical protein
MTMKTILAALPLAATLLTIAAPAAAEEGRPAPAVLPSPPEGQGQVVFWRPGTMVGAAMGCGVNEGTTRISSLGAGKYLVMNMAPGTYEFSARSEARDTLRLEVEPGEVVYVRCTIRMGIMVGRPNLAPSTAEEFNARRENLDYVDSDDIALPERVLADPGTPATR